MTVAALIITTGTSCDDRTLARLVDAAWSGGAHPILVSGLSVVGEPPTPARRTPSADPVDALVDARGEVRATTAILTIPIAYAGVDPETLTSLIAAHGKAPFTPLRAAFNGVGGEIRLLPMGQGDTNLSAEPLLVECGDEAALLPSDGSSSLRFDAPPSDPEAVDPWERRGDQDR